MKKKPFTVTLHQVTRISAYVAFLFKYQLTFTVTHTCNPVSWEVEAEDQSPRTV